MARIAIERNGKIDLSIADRQERLVPFHADEDWCKARVVEFAGAGYRMAEELEATIHDPDHGVQRYTIRCVLDTDQGQKIVV